MLPIQRKSKVIEYLAQKGECTIKELSQLFNVSEMTIRRDLKQLEAEGIVLPSHGGVVYVKSLMREPALYEKEAKYKDVKDRIAAYTVEHFIKDGDVLILEGGTTVSRMTSYLYEYTQLTILTNGLDTLNRLRGMSERSTVLCCGGTLREASGTFVGPVAQSFFGEFHANTVFLSALGYTPESGFTDPNMMDTQIKKAMIRSSQQTVMLIDSSKFGEQSFTTSVTVNDIIAVVTDDGISDQMKSHFKEKGIQLHII